MESDKLHADGYANTLAEDGRIFLGEDQIIPIDGFRLVGRYHDKYVRTEDGWKFAERRLQRVFSTAE